MAAIITKKLRVHSALQFVESLSEAANINLYVAIGRTDAWSDDVNPPTPTNSEANTTFDYWRDAIALKKVSTTDVSHVIPRYNWTTNTVYTQYDHRSANLYAQTFYVLTSSFGVYKCLYNNNGANSTIEPTGTGNTVISTGDGYKWKYLYTISTTDALKFLTTTFMPVKTLTADDSSTQWPIQQYAATSNGALDVIQVTAGGTGYDPATTTVSITGDGTGASVNSTSFTIAANVVTAISLSTRGQDYSNAVVTISSSGVGTGATAVALIPPYGYHGSDPVEELGASYVMINTQLAGSENNAITITNNYRRIMLVRDPKLTSNGALATGSVYRQTYNLVLTSPSGTFTTDEVVTGGTSGATARLVDWNATGNGNTARLTAVSKAFAVAETVTGGTSGVTGTVASISQPELQPFSGDVLYVEQRTPIARANDQTESLKIVIQF